MDKNLEQISQWVTDYERKVRKGEFSHLTKFRKREWEALYSLALQQLEKE